MTTDLSLTSLTQAEYDAAEQTLLAMVRAEYPTLDLRRGTTLRDIVIRPAASIYAYQKKLNTQIQQTESLQAIKDSGGTVDDATGILNNFMITPVTGTNAYGVLKVAVDASRTYDIVNATVFTNLAGVSFQTTQAYTVKVGADPAAGELELYPAPDGTYFYFLLPVTATVSGLNGQIKQGEALAPEIVFFGYVSAQAYNDFVGGSNPETMDQLLARMPAAITYRALESPAAIETKLRNYLSTLGLPLYAISVQGYGAATQLRDKHNPMGLAVGSRVDLYPRTFMTPVSVPLAVTGTRVGANTYNVTLTPATAPGMVTIKAISEPDVNSATEAGANSFVALGSYDFTEVRSGYGTQDTWHDLDPANLAIETAFTMYQQLLVTITGVPDTAATHEFKLEYYAVPGLADLQTYVDDPQIRNVESDYIVRCPLFCLVSVSARAYYPHTSTIDLAGMKGAVRDYVNGRNFTRRLSRSELVPIMRDYGVTRVDLGLNGMVLSGTILDASNTYHTITGDELDLDSVADSSVLLASETCIFVTDLNYLAIEAIAE